MKKLFVPILLILSTASVVAQDSLRLTIRLEGFKKSDQLSIRIGGSGYNIPTSESEFQGIPIYLDKPQTGIVLFKNRFKSFWLENGDMELFISKSQFPKNVKISGSKSEELWNTILAANQDERAKILEKNIDHPVVNSYMMNSRPNLKPADLDRIRNMMSDEVNDFAKYNVTIFRYDKKEAVKKGDQLFDFVARTLNDEVIDTKALRGSYLLLDFAGTGCGYCWLSYPKMQELLPNYENLKVITFNNDYFIDKWEQIAERNNVDLPWPVLWKAENKREILEKYGVNIYPTYVLISPEGEILEYWRGSREEKLKSRLERHISE